MEGLTVLTWLWGTKYSREYAERLNRGFARHLKQPHQFMVVAPDERDPLLKERGCFVRLRMFDPEWQRRVIRTERVVCVDLDVVVTGNLDPLFDRPETFAILQGANSVNPCPYNGSLMMFRVGHHHDVWTDFSVLEAYKLPYFQFPDDQGWLAHKLPNAAGWQCGVKSGVWSFRKRGWPYNDTLPANARLVCFPGANDPSMFEDLPWIKRYWT